MNPLFTADEVVTLFCTSCGFEWQAGWFGDSIHKLSGYFDLPDCSECGAPGAEDG